MKFSVLLPTRNRLKYLKYAVNSVLAQDYANWEIIISDNDSEEDVFSYIESLNDKRIKYYRTKNFISVTENWNNTINHCTGDYVIMLGDDDILLKRYFSTMLELLEQYNHPNVIYANAYLYFYPGVYPKHPKGLLHSCADFSIFQSSKEPFWLTKEKAMHLVQGHLDFNALFGTNMQYVLMKQSVIEKTKMNNQFFHSPYPDVYLMNVMILETENILICPKEMVVIGVTPKSTGNFIVNYNEKKGMDFLNISKELGSIETLTSIILPSSLNLTSWLIAMETVKIYLKDKYDLRVNYQRYRYLQIENALIIFFSQKENEIDINQLFKMLSFKEKILLFIPRFSVHFFKRIFSKEIRRFAGKIRDKIFGKISITTPQFIDEEFSNISEIFEQYENGSLYTRDQIKEFVEAFKTGKTVDDICKSYGISQAFLEKWVNGLNNSESSSHEQIKGLCL